LIYLFIFSWVWFCSTKNDEPDLSLLIVGCRLKDMVEVAIFECLDLDFKIDCSALVVVFF